jgi:hypothetical protein
VFVWIETSRSLRLHGITSQKNTIHVFIGILYTDIKECQFHVYMSTFVFMCSVCNVLNAEFIVILTSLSTNVGEKIVELYLWQTHFLISSESENCLFWLVKKHLLSALNSHNVNNSNWVLSSFFLLLCDHDLLTTHTLWHISLSVKEVLYLFCAAYQQRMYERKMILTRHTLHGSPWSQFHWDSLTLLQQYK